LVTFLLALSIGLMAALFLLAAIVTSVESQSIFPALLILVPIAVPASLLVIIIRDMQRAYVEIEGDLIRTVDYRFGRKKERLFRFSDIAKAEVFSGYSHKVRGLRYAKGGFRYIVFTGSDGSYLFKIIYLPETYRYFKNYFI